MITYKFLKMLDGSIMENFIRRLPDNLCIPFDANNKDYQTYLKWLDGYEHIDGQWVKTSNGNTPLPADE